MRQYDWSHWLTASNHPRALLLKVESIVIYSEDLEDLRGLIRNTRTQQTSGPQDTLPINLGSLHNHH